MFQADDTGIEAIHGFVIGHDWIGINDILMDPAQMSESDVGGVSAFWADAGASTAVMVHTTDGWQHVATLIGTHDPNMVFDVIEDGGLFAAPNLAVGPGDFA